jgi:uncharacterized membrane protein HdeD (DUF308 family)
LDLTLLSKRRKPNNGSTGKIRRNEMTTVSDLFAAGLEQVRKSWGWFLVSGIALMILGVVCIGKAQTATTFSILALGWILAISAAFWFISSFYAFSWQGFFLYLLNALIRGVTGYLLIRHPDAGAEGVTMVLAVLFIVGGIFRASAAGTIQFPRWRWTMFAGLVSVGLGIYLLATFPATSTYFIGLAIGIDLIFDGGSLVGFAGAIHSLPSVQTRAAA